MNLLHSIATVKNYFLEPLLVVVMETVEKTPETTYLFYQAKKGTCSVAKRKPLNDSISTPHLSQTMKLYMFLYIYCTVLPVVKILPTEI
jgi:hypothetical protein